MLKLGQLIRQKRREAGMTQSELAEKVGITDGYIGKIEIGVQAPSYKTLHRIARILNIDRDELPLVTVDGDFLAELNVLEEKRGELDRKFSDLHPKLKSFLLEIVPIAERYI